MREVLSRRALGRATLERQLLLRRSDMSVLGAVEHVSSAPVPRPWPSCSSRDASCASSACGRRSTSSPRTTRCCCVHSYSLCSTPSSRGTGTSLGCVPDDGSVCAVWRLERDRDTGGATLVVSHVGKRPAAAVAAEGRRFLRFAAADATSHDIRFVAVD